MQYTEQELSKLIEDVEKEFTTHLAKAEEFAKSEETAVPALAEAAPTETVEAKPEEVQKSETSEPVQKAEAKEEKHDEKHDDEHCDYDEKDHEEMHKMYSSMSKGELKAHHASVQKAMEHCGMAKCGEIMKTETTVVEAKPEVTVETPVIEAAPSDSELLKSENAELKKANEELKKNLEVVTEFISKLNKKIAPPAKAITNLDVIAKSEGSDSKPTLTKSQVTEILLKKSQDPSLSKADREAINGFYLNKASIETVSHLLG